ncbi:MAG: hypothetical protein Q8942_09535 [Bacillota bacterium]|nr:hypothetical protein [Bacillota bacterium]
MRVILLWKKNSENAYKKIFIENNNVVGAIVIGDTNKSPLLKGH